MPRYSIFGGCLDSELDFPELHPGNATAPSWRFRVVRGAPSGDPGSVLGIGTEPNCRVILYRSGNGFHLHHSCTGDFLLSAKGTDITWYARDGASEEMGRGDIMGRVLSVAMHASGKLALHGSGVRIGDAAIAFLAPKGYGKSTLALSLVNAGARLVTDDTVAVDPTLPVTVLPGVHRMRLCDDAATRFVPAAAAAERGVDGKRVIDERADARRILDPAPLAAIYLLAPVRAEHTDQVVQRRLLPARLAAMSLVRHAKIGALLGGTEAPLVIERAAAIARSIPVYELTVVRDLDRMNRVVDQLMAWHGAEYAGGVR